jgi:DNA relaxase NicK
MRVKRAHRLKGERQGDWEDFPEQGRTQYLGARSSVVRGRLYEKGLQPEYVHLGRSDWVRMELQVRPAKDAKTIYAGVSPLDAWGASTWAKDLAAEILADHVSPHPAGYTWRKTDLERRLDWICKQAGPTLLELHGHLGSWECVGLTLGEMMREKHGVSGS